MPLMALSTLFSLVFLGYSSFDLNTLIFMSVFFLCALFVGFYAINVIFLKKICRSNQYKFDDPNIDSCQENQIKIDKNKRYKICFWLIFSGIFLGIILSFRSLYFFQQSLITRASQAQVIFLVKSIYANSVSVEIININNAPQLSGYYLQVKLKKSDNLLLGATYLSTLKLSPITGNQVLGKRLFIYNQVSNGEIGRAEIQSLALIKSPNALSNQRLLIHQYLEKNFEYGTLLSALTTGITTNVSMSDWGLFRETGTVHLISISGLHLSIVAGWLFIILRFFLGILNIQRPQPFVIAAICSILISILYALFAGFGLPIVRSLLMFIFIMLSLIMRRQLISLDNISTVLLIVLIFWPFSIFQAGFWLSFLAVACFIFEALSVKKTARFDAKPIWKKIFKIQLCLSIILMPLTAYFFGTVSIVSPVANLLAIPLTTIFVMPPLMLGVILLCISDAPIVLTICNFLFNISDISMGALKFILTIFSSIPAHEITFGITSIGLAIFLTCMLCIIFFRFAMFAYFIKKIIAFIFKVIIFKVIIFKFINFKFINFKFINFKFINFKFINFKFINFNVKNTVAILTKNSRIMFMCILFIFGFSIAVYQYYLFDKRQSMQDRMIVFPAGDGLSVLLQKSKVNILYDNGRYFRGIETAKTIILPIFKYLSINSLNYMVLSHDNNQHIGGTKTLRTHFPEAKIIAHPSLQYYIEGAIACKPDQLANKFLTDLYFKSNFFIDEKLLNISAKILPISSSCNLEIMSGIHRIWLLSDMSKMEWNELTDLLMYQKLDKPDIMLMPNQGRSKGFILPKVLAANPDLLVILSTKNVHLDVLKDLQKYKFQVLNANEGVIMIDFYDTFFKATQNKASNQHWWLRKF